MSADTLIKEIKALPATELEKFLSHFLTDPELTEEIERMGYLKLAENAFSFWNDPREDVYQDYARPVPAKKE